MPTKARAKDRRIDYERPDTTSARRAQLQPYPAAVVWSLAIVCPTPPPPPPPPPPPVSFKSFSTRSPSRYRITCASSCHQREPPLVRLSLFGPCLFVSTLQTHIALMPRRKTTRTTGDVATAAAPTKPSKGSGTNVAPNRPRAIALPQRKPHLVPTSRVPGRWHRSQRDPPVYLQLAFAAAGLWQPAHRSARDVASALSRTHRSVSSSSSPLLLLLHLLLPCPLHPRRLSRRRTRHVHRVSPRRRSAHVTPPRTNLAQTRTSHRRVGQSAARVTVPRFAPWKTRHRKNTKCSLRDPSPSPPP